MTETQYYGQIKNKKISIFGITPPPFGGVSIHIQRVAQKFKENKNQVYHFKTEFRGRRYVLPFYLLYAAFFLIKNKIDIVYYHSLSQPNSFTEISFLVQLKKLLRFNLVLVEHNCQHMYKRKKRQIKHFNRALKNVNHLVFMGKLPHKSYTDNGVNINKKYTIDHAFLPPDITQANNILKSYPTALHNFIKKHKTLLLANASNLSFTNGKEVYGLNKCINAVSSLKQGYPYIGLILALSHIGNKEYFNKLLLNIKNLDLEKNIFFLTGRQEIWPLFKIVDIFLRPTLCDGASISVKEAIMCSATVIASNVCKRPSEVTTFDIKDEADFIKKIKNEIRQRQEK